MTIDANSISCRSKSLAEIQELRRKKVELQKELRLLNTQLASCSSDDDDDTDDSGGKNVIPGKKKKTNGSPGGKPERDTASVMSKSGYLFKWQDRSIGWSGTKWALRFVQLSNGRLSYYLSHLESSSSPRYILSLRGCAIADEGWKRNKRHTSKVVPKGEDPPIDEVGAYFFVFSIYHRPDSIIDLSAKSPSSSSSLDISKLPNDYVPLLRFSTPSLAEKNQWIKLLSEACAYCETDAFLEEEATRNAEEEFRRQQQQQLAMAMPQAERGTLPPLYFAPSNETKRGLHVRRPSFSKLPNSSMYRTVAKSRDAEKSERQGFPASKPMHRSAAPSVLSGESGSTQNYRGFFNLGVIILIVSNFRLILNAVRKHGFVLAQIDLDGISKFSLDHWEQFPFLTGLLLLQGCLVAAFAIEWMMARKQLYESVGMILHQLNAHSSFVTTIFIVWNFIDNPSVGGTLLMTGAITWMKLISYALANEDYRNNAKNKKKQESIQTNLAQIENLDEKDWEVEYPSNVTLANMYYFWCAPTLTYQIAFPKTPKVRPLRVVGILVRMIVTLSVFTFLVYQIVAPNLENLLNDLDATGGRYTTSILAEYWLKLTITNTYMWLLMFYFYFHLYLNLFAELLRFGDRVFCKSVVLLSYETRMSISGQCYVLTHKHCLILTHAHMHNINR
jgi:diacylglycerol O-acyltransferase-1